MDRITINPSRLLWGCRERGVDLDQLAAETRIAVNTLNRALSGAGGLTFRQLQNLAKYFDRGVLFFLENGEPEAEDLYSPQFRTLENQKPELTQKVRALIQRVERQRTVYVELREGLGDDDWIPYQPFSLPTNDIPLAAAMAREWLGLEEENRFQDFREAVEARGILVFRTNGYNGDWQIPRTDSIEGFCLYENVCPVIVVRKHGAEARQTFTLFHELGHILLHRGSYIDDQDDFTIQTGHERAANRFAGQILVPDSFLDQIDMRERPEEVSGFELWLRGYCVRWGVSTEVVLRRLRDAGMVQDRDYEDYRDWRDRQVRPQREGGNRAARYREPLDVFGPTFTRTVFEALGRDQITSNTACRYLDNVKISDLRQLEGHLASY